MTSLEKSGNGREGEAEMMGKRGGVCGQTCYLDTNPRGVACTLEV